ncbi:hypothetical protein [Corynebacterium wankanglinii]|uniref:Uncharacterized protein n=1 Tax=Corynebacterium wankanglinii TaxID=2735136 RepID=A0A838CGL8_9CORY|nr:hypothetical protein [Corynebacterium wankanglinii]MBA1834144.1 hypothetical protein [Corynebacterium wankanglinii]
MSDLYAVTFHNPNRHYRVLQLSEDEAQRWANALGHFSIDLPQFPAHPFQIAPIVEDPDGEVRYLGKQYRRGQALKEKAVANV